MSQEKRGTYAVDEVGVGDEGGGEADDGPVEAHDEDLGVGVEGLGDVQVQGDEGPEPVLPGVEVVGVVPADGHVGAAVGMRSG